MEDTLLVLEKMRKSYGDSEDNAEKVRVVEAVLADFRQQEETECDCEVKEGEKCPHDMIELAPKPFGGSTSFSDHDEYQDAIDTEMHQMSDAVDVERHEGIGIDQPFDDVVR